TIGFTYSRGGLVALAAGLFACVALSGSRLRVLMWLGAAALAALPSLVLGLTSHALTANGVPLSRRETAGGLLLVVIVAASVMLWLGSERLLRAERRVVLSPTARRRVVRGLLGCAGACVVLGALAVGLSARGFTGTFSHLWTSFTTTQGVSVSNPSRLLSADSANRWVWWKEAAGAFSSRPLAGWGAGSFPVVHLLYRRDLLTVQHPHSVPLQWLAETGIVGFLIAAAAWVLLLRGALRGLRRRGDGAGRLLAAGLFAAAVAYTVHALYDWDWDIPGVTLPVLIILGVLGGAGAGRVRRVDGRWPPARSALPQLLALAAVTLALCVFALSAVVPNLAASRASAALVAASGTSESALERAQHDAVIATSLDPVSDAGLRVEAAVAEHRDDPQLARAYLLEAVQRQPSDVEAWGSLAWLDVQLGRLRQGMAAAQNVLELDPLDYSVRLVAVGVAQAVELAEAPPQSSATAIATPSPGATP
ncbi:MAG TPA: O-antigen ligase family protein, partial [Gaiellaceae bacterium]|nr:O-antigen ligase family protein [Gaiellaceae bacterium]